MLQELIEAEKHQGEILRQCSELIDTGKLKIYLNQTFPLSAAAAAHQAIESGSMTGKVALAIDK